MNPVSREALTQLLIVHEGERLKPYLDTVGKVTIGVGRNLTDKGISLAESRFLLSNDIDEVQTELDPNVPFWRSLDDVRQRALADACFNLGIGNLMQFHGVLSALAAGRWGEAAEGMLNSLWARQVPNRVKDLAEMIRSGQDVKR